VTDTIYAVYIANHHHHYYHYHRHHHHCHYQNHYYHHQHYHHQHHYHHYDRHHHQVVKGIQGQGIIANAKHFVNNEIETHRMSVSAIVDERVRFELYYPPFQVRVRVGVRVRVSIIIILRHSANRA
jgi:hypothetical protein